MSARGGMDGGIRICGYSYIDRRLRTPHDFTGELVRGAKQQLAPFHINYRRPLADLLHDGRETVSEFC